VSPVDEHPVEHLEHLPLDDSGPAKQKCTSVGSGSAQQSKRCDTRTWCASTASRERTRASGPRQRSEGVVTRSRRARTHAHTHTFVLAAGASLTLTLYQKTSWRANEMPRCTRELGCQFEVVIDTARVRVCEREVKTRRGECGFAKRKNRARHRQEHASFVTHQSCGCGWSASA
jgi:hypothetical protein